MHVCTWGLLWRAKENSPKSSSSSSVSAMASLIDMDKVNHIPHSSFSAHEAISNLLQCVRGKVLYYQSTKGTVSCSHQVKTVTNRCQGWTEVREAFFTECLVELPMED